MQNKFNSELQFCQLENDTLKEQLIRLKAEISFLKKGKASEHKYILEKCSHDDDENYKIFDELGYVLKTFRAKNEKEAIDVYNLFTQAEDSLSRAKIVIANGRKDNISFSLCNYKTTFLNFSNELSYLDYYAISFDKQIKETFDLDKYTQEDMLKIYEIKIIEYFSQIQNVSKVIKTN